MVMICDVNGKFKLGERLKEAMIAISYTERLVVSFLSMQGKSIERQVNQTTVNQKWFMFSETLAKSLRPSDLFVLSQFTLTFTIGFIIMVIISNTIYTFISAMVGALGLQVVVEAENLKRHSECFKERSDSYITVEALSSRDDETNRIELGATDGST